MCEVWSWCPCVGVPCLTAAPQCLSDRTFYFQLLGFERPQRVMKTRRMIAGCLLAHVCVKERCAAVGLACGCIGQVGAVNAILPQGPDN